jgi:lysophospholipase L1-like esterase
MIISNNRIQQDIPSWSNVSSNLSVRRNNNSRLLITVGDSWTWGDSLGGSCARDSIDTIQARLDLTYGAHLSSRLDADWVNISLPGISNHQMLSWLEWYLEDNSLSQYTTVDIVICLTESGRHEEICIANSFKSSSLQVALDYVLDKTYQRIQSVSNKYPEYKIHTSHSFTDGNVIIHQSWLEVMLDRLISNDTRIVVSEHIVQLCNNVNYQDKIEIVDKAINRINLLDQCNYTNKQDTRHPTSQGHQLWANYLYERLI